MQEHIKQKDQFHSDKMSYQPYLKCSDWKANLTNEVLERPYSPSFAIQNTVLPN